MSEFERSITPTRYKQNPADRALADELMAKAGVPSDLVASIDVWTDKALVWVYPHDPGSRIPNRLGYEHGPEAVEVRR